jgi:recombinational DNA repair protein (RecF pathway)
MLKKNGIDFWTERCVNCSVLLKNEAYLTNRGLFCNKCKSKDYIKILDPKDISFFMILGDPNAYKLYNIDETFELHILDILIKYIESYTNKKVKSLENLKVFP